MKVDILEKIAGIQIFYEFEGQGIFLRFSLLVFLGIFIIVPKYDFDDQRVRELVDRDELRGKIMGNLSFEAVFGPIVSRLGQLEDPALDAPDGSPRGNCDVVLKDRLLRHLYWEEIGPQLEGRSDCAKVRPGRKFSGLDSELFHAIYEIILRLVGDTNVQSRWDILEEYALIQMRLE